MSELSQVHAQHVRSFKVADAVAATVSKAEAARLATNPTVAAVIPDSVVKGAPSQALTKAAAQEAGTAAGPGVCPAPGAKPLLEPEALSVTHTASDDPSAKTARSLGYTGAGVKVAYIAEGIDIDNPDFIRADGSHVFADYEDFTGDGPNAPTSGGEAFLDASAIAAQGRQVYDISHFGAHPLPTPCDVRIEGVAPGASLYGFKVFGNTNFSTTSAILQSIDWAVNVDHVDVINESFGFNPFPDNGSADAVKLFDDMAVAAGVTVTVSSGDAGPTSTQGSPSTDPNVISVGASTTFRWLAQTDYAAARTFAPNGWLNDNVSTLSSSGVTADGQHHRPARPRRQQLRAVHAQSRPLRRLRRLQRQSVRCGTQRRHERVGAADRRRGRAGDPGVPARPPRREPDPGPGQADPGQHGRRPDRARRRAGRRPAGHLQGGPGGAVGARRQRRPVPPARPCWSTRPSSTRPHPPAATNTGS